MGCGVGGDARHLRHTGAATASTTFTFFVLVLQNVCGFYLSLDVVPKALSWLSYLSVYYYGEVFRLTQVETNRPGARRVCPQQRHHVYAFLYHDIALFVTILKENKRRRYVDRGAVAGAPDEEAQERGGGGGARLRAFRWL